MNVNTVFLSQSGWTPLHAAAERVSVEVVMKLADSGAYLCVRDKVRRFFLSNYIVGCIAPKSLSVIEFVLRWLTCAVFVKLKRSL